MFFFTVSITVKFKQKKAELKVQNINFIDPDCIALPQASSPPLRLDLRIKLER